VQEKIEPLREVLAFAFEISLMIGQAPQTEISRKLAILAVPRAVAGIYGVNFEHMPELQWKHGCAPVLLALLALPPEPLAPARHSRRRIVPLR
jgi:magnesium transporter